MENNQNTKIFGYDWRDIKRAQQKGGTLSKQVPVSDTNKEILMKGDLSLLRKHGYKKLIEMKYFGVIDRLQRAENKKEK